MVENNPDSEASSINEDREASAASTARPAEGISATPTTPEQSVRRSTLGKAFHAVWRLLAAGARLLAGFGRRWLSSLKLWLFLLMAIPVLSISWVIVTWKFGTTSESTTIATQAGFSWLTETHLYVLFFFLGGIGLLLISSNMKLAQAPTPSEKRWTLDLLRLLIHEIGIAVVVACVVTAIFELSMHERERKEQAIHEKTLEEDVFKAVFGRGIDHEMIDEVVSSVFRSSFMREDLGLNYDFFCKDPTKEYVRVRVSVTYRLKNMTPERQPYTPVHRFHTVYPDKNEPDSFVSFNIVDETESPKNKAIMEIGPKELLSHRGELFECTKVGTTQELKILRPIDIEPGKSVVVRYAYEVSKRRADLITYHTTHSTKQFHFKITKGEGVSDLRFTVDSAHPQKPIITSPPIDEEKAISTEWKINSAVLAGQGVEIYWYPIQPKVDN